MLYTEHVILWQGHLANYTTLGIFLGVRDRIRSQVWYNSVGGDQIEIWWVFETGSEINYSIIAWAVPKSRQDDRQQYTFEGRTQWKNTEKTLDKKGDKLTDNDRAFGHWPLLCNDLGVCSGRQRQRFNKWTRNVFHDSSESVLNTDRNEMRHISKTNCMRERWIYIIKSIQWCATVPTTFTVVLKSQVPNDLKSKQKTWERPPIKRW